MQERLHVSHTESSLASMPASGENMIICGLSHGIEWTACLPGIQTLRDAVRIQRIQQANGIHVEHRLDCQPSVHESR